MAEFLRHEAQLVGINPGSLRSHQGFSAKMGLGFPLLVDEGRQVAAAYGTLKPNGTSIERTVIIVDKSGRVVFREKGTPPTDRLLAVLGKLADGAV